MSVAPTIKRRAFLKSAAALAALTAWSPGQAKNLLQQLQLSALVYLTPIQSDGQLSRCQAEVWFVWNGADIYVCSASSSWRSQAARSGLNNTRLWVGDLGVWTQAKYQQLPSLEARAYVINDPSLHKPILDLFANKYPLGWIRWGATFRNGLADGTRTLIKYHPQL